MKLRFDYANTQMTEKYRGKDDPRDHLALGTKAWGTKSQLEWVHIFCHILDTIPMKWYLEIELCHGIAKWDIFWESFLLTFNFEDGFESIDEALQEIKVAIFRMPKELIKWTQLD